MSSWEMELLQCGIGALANRLIQPPGCSLLPKAIPLLSPALLRHVELLAQNRQCNILRLLIFSFYSVSSSFAEESNKKHPFPCPTTYRTALTYYLDITNPPRTNVLYELAQYAMDAGEQDRLRKMASSAAEGKVGAAAFPAKPLG